MATPIAWRAVVLMVAIRCQAVDVARNISTVWRTVATGERWLRENGGYGRVVATGEWWLRASGGYGRAIRLCILN
jgi:hypothetical protein